MIKITVVSYNNQRSLAPLSAIFGRDGGTLGRSEENFFVLPDSKHLVSRVQALVKSDGQRHTIVSLSQANPVLLNGVELPFERETPFKPSDELQVGPYVLFAEAHLAAVNEGEPIKLAAVPNVQNAQNPANAPIGATVIPISAATAQTADLPATEQAVASRGLPAPIHTSTSEFVQGDDHRALLGAFLQGAGIPEMSVGAGLTTEFMETIGKLLAATIDGTYELVGSRALSKREVKADVTMVVVRNNNPLKFLPDSKAVLMQMLRKKMPGFMGPVEAVQDAFSDLEAHQKGTMAGMHGVIDAVLQRLDPQAIASRTTAPTLIEGLMPARRSARMWEQSTALFEQTMHEVHDDFQKYFGNAFVLAYEAEIERLRDAEPS